MKRETHREANDELLDKELMDDEEIEEIEEIFYHDWRDQRPSTAQFIFDIFLAGAATVILLYWVFH